MGTALGLSLFCDEISNQTQRGEGRAYSAHISRLQSITVRRPSQNLRSTLHHSQEWTEVKTSLLPACSLYAQLACSMHKVHGPAKGMATPIRRLCPLPSVNNEDTPTRDAQGPT